MKYTVSFLVLHFFVLSCPASGKSHFDQLLSQIWQYELSVKPIKASTYGMHDYDDRLDDISPKGLAKRDIQFRQFVKALDEYDKNLLSRSEQITLLMQKRRLQNDIDLYRFKAHYMPITSESGFHSKLAFLPRSNPFKTTADYQRYLARLSQFPEYFKQHINWMRKGIQTGFVQPGVVLKGIEDSVKSFIHDSAEDSLYYTPFKTLQTSSLSQSEQAKVKKQATLVIKENVYTAYQHFYDFLINEYIPKSKSDIAASSWQQGRDYYQNRSNFYTTTTMSADEIYILGLAEVKRIRSEMKQLINELKFEGDIQQFIQYLRNDKKFYAQSADELIKQASFIAKKMDAKLPELFSYLPRTPYGVEAVPSNIAPKYTTGRYIAPTRSDQPGYYWVNTYALDKRPLYALTALTLHEAVPGHHLQISLSREMRDMPDVRRYTYISAFGEGWGLYSEFLGKEVGMYDDPYDEFGRLSYEMWRACRLVVDTGMHTKNWSRQKALDYMLENTALSEHNVETEIDRYISWPAQALSYKIGELTIKALRKKAETALGSKFDIRAFHNTLLEHGSVPLSVLETNVQHFIDKQ